MTRFQIILQAFHKPLCMEYMCGSAQKLYKDSYLLYWSNIQTK
jgi:hypothetical protein